MQLHCKTANPKCPILIAARRESPPVLVGERERERRRERERISAYKLLTKRARRGQSKQNLMNVGGGLLLAAQDCNLNPHTHTHTRQQRQQQHELAICSTANLMSDFAVYRIWGWREREKVKLYQRTRTA